MTTRPSQNAFRFGQACFKPVDGGFLFETPNPWIFAPGRRYVVTEAQRSALVDIITPRRPVLLVVVISVLLVVLGAGIGLLWWRIGGHENPTARDLLGMIVTAAVLVYPAGVVLVRRHLRRIAPIVAGAVPTQAKLTVLERYQAVGDAMPTRLLKIGVVIWSLSLVMQVVSLAMPGVARPLLSHPEAIFKAIMPLAFLVVSVYLLRRRSRQNHAYGRGPVSFSYGAMSSAAPPARRGGAALGCLLRGRVSVACAASSPRDLAFSLLGFRYLAFATWPSCYLAFSTLNSMRRFLARFASLSFAATGRVSP